MNFKKTLVLLFAVFVFMAGNLYAEEKKKEKKNDFQFKGKVFLNWHTNLTDSTSTEEADQKNTFEFERLYLIAIKPINDIFSFKVTLDFSNDSILEKISDTSTGIDTDGDGTSNVTVTSKTGSTTSKYRVFVKNGYLQAKKSFGDISTKLQVGMIGTPIIGFTEKLQDQRWISKNILNSSSAYMPGGLSGVDNSADMGLSLELKMLKMITIVGALTNGEGYKKSLESLSADSAHGKAYYGRLTVTPIKSLYLSGYYRYEGTAVDESDNNKGFYGVGTAWKDELISVGANYYQIFINENGSDKTWSGTNIYGLAFTGDYKVSLLDTWMSFYLKSLIDVPVFAMIKYGYGKDKKLAHSETSLMGGGAGYEYNKNIRVIAWYQQLDDRADDNDNKPNPEKSFWIKSEIKW